MLANPSRAVIYKFQFVTFHLYLFPLPNGITCIYFLQSTCFQLSFDICSRTSPLAPPVLHRSSLRDQVWASQIHHRAIDSSLLGIIVHRGFLIGFAYASFLSNRLFEKKRKERKKETPGRLGICRSLPKVRCDR